MAEPIIKVESLSKRFIISHERKEQYTSLRDEIMRWVKGLSSGSKNRQQDVKEEFLALNNVNFQIEKGDRVGIIGRNGAGKSTLLKVLSRITDPSEGRIDIEGRVASLLEVGTGFHPELTGRENIYLNGAILGMSRAEIRSKFDEIVAFAEVEQFLDTPVKRYSSGMYVRLAFAVAAHLEPEILIVDEVLAVGDAAFQKKCLGKMEDVSKGGGRTVLFVSHNMAAVKSLCNKVFVLEKGTVKFAGDTDEGVTYYLRGNSETQNRKTFGNDFDTDKFTLHEIAIQAQGKSEDDVLDEYNAIDLTAVLTVKEDTSHLHFTYVLNSETGEPLFTFSHVNAGKKLVKGQNRITCTFPKGFLNVGAYYLTVYIIEDLKHTVLVEKDIMTFDIQVGERGLGTWTGREPGFIKPVFAWEVTQK